MGIVSGVLFFMAYLPYAWAILNHQTVPSPVSWGIWACVDTLALIAMMKKKAGIGQIIGAVAGSWVITVLAIIFGKPSMGIIEWVSIVGALSGIVLWHRTKNATTAIICSQAATFIAAIPTFATGFANPGLENSLAWSIWFLSCVCALFAVKKWDLENSLQPINFTIIETVMVFLVVIRPHLL
jgi:hypothetical protein